MVGNKNNIIGLPCRDPLKRFSPKAVEERDGQGYKTTNMSAVNAGG
jgi:hypothetical protein